MANLDTGKLSAPDTRFTQVQARKAPDVRAENLAKLGPLAKTAGAGYARQQGGELAGVDSTQEEINDQAEMIDSDINAMLTAEQPTQTGAPLDERRVGEIKDKALTAYAKNDRVLLALRDQGTISTLEARARRQLNLKRALSNPVNALFKKDFLNASGDLTGGGNGAVNAMFAETKEEILARSIQEEQIKAEAKYEGAVRERQAATGKPETVIRSEMAQEAEDKQRMQELERVKTTQGLNANQYLEAHSLYRNSASRGIYLQLATMNKADGGNGLNVDSMQTLKQTVDQTYRSLLREINEGDVSSNGKPLQIGQTQRDSALAELEKWHTGVKSSMELYDAGKYNKAQIEELEQASTLMGYKHTPQLMIVQTQYPDLAPLVLAEGGLNENIDRFVGAGTSKSIISISERLSALVDFGEAKPPVNEEAARKQAAVITDNGSQKGLELTTSPAVRDNPDRAMHFKKLFESASPELLISYTSTDSQRMAPSNDILRGDMNEAMLSTKDRIDRIKSRIGADNQLIWAEPQEKAAPVEGFNSTVNPRPNLRRNENPQWILNLPNDMKEFAGDIKTMHDFVGKHPWSWNHVKENYVDASDAFNGYMRGEWDVNVNMDDGITPEGGLRDAPEPTKEQLEAEGRIRPEPTVDKGTPLDAPKEINLGSELDRLTAGNEADEQKLADLLQQRIDARNKERPSSGVRAPGIMNIADKAAEAKGSMVTEGSDTFPTVGVEFDPAELEKMVEGSAEPKAFDPAVHLWWLENYNADKANRATVEPSSKKNMIKVLTSPTAKQKKNLDEAKRIVSKATLAFEQEMKKFNVTEEELQRFVAHTYAAETKAGTSRSLISKTGAAGDMQILPSTAKSLMGRSGTGSMAIFGPKAQALTGFDIEAFVKADRKTQQQMLIDNKEANIVLALAKFFERKYVGK